MQEGRYFSKKDCKYYWVNVEKHSHDYIDCECCGKALRTVYVVYDEQDETEGFYGSECVKTMKLEKAE